MCFYARLICVFIIAAPMNFLTGAPYGPPSSFSTIFTRINCSSAALNGVIDIGCWGYEECVNGVIIRHGCIGNHVFERDTMTCVTFGSGHTDCNKIVSCVGKNGLYADREDGCQTYITCLGGIYMGRQYCPANLVFNETLQTCDYPDNVEPPCGSKQITG